MSFDVLNGHHAEESRNNGAGVAPPWLPDLPVGHVLTIPLVGTTYIGVRVPSGCYVFVWDETSARPLPPRYDLRDHSQDGFEWGYCGSGPAQLALAILADFTKDDAVALKQYQRFKQLVIAQLPRNRIAWRISGSSIEEFLSSTAEL